jgi:tetratricopeptide (TPR) repeat protein
MADAERPRPNGGAAMAEQLAADDPPEPKARVDRSNNARANELASKYIGYGDALFAKQKYVEANDRYRQAARSAPQVATVWFREGFALAAMGRCDQAAAAMKRGLALDPAWPTSKFDVAQLFGGNAAAKNARLDALAAAVKDKPADADRLFVLGVFLHFDGQPDRARTIFERAEKIVGNNVGHIEAFMDDDEDE